MSQKYSTKICAERKEHAKIREYQRACDVGADYEDERRQLEAKFVRRDHISWPAVVLFIPFTVMIGYLT